MQTLYLDLFSGISGDMFLGALLDLGVEFARLEQELAKLHLEGYHLHAARQKRANISGMKFDVCFDDSPVHEEQHVPELNAGGEKSNHHLPLPPSHSLEEPQHRRESGHGRSFAQIQQLIGSSPFSAWVKEKALAVFHRIAVAEGRIHGCPSDAVHFHEVGAIDSIVDIVGAFLALDLLGRPRLLASPVVEGTGWVACAHGRFPLPAPATLAILGARGIAISQCEEPHELVTPTGAALLAEFAERVGPMQDLVATRVGYGLGSRDNPTRPNVLRAILSETQAATDRDWETDSIAVLETNLDDINAEILGHFVETAFAAGALDVFHTPVQMKKNRPGVLLTVLCSMADADPLTELMLRETSAFGVRRTVAERRKLRRDFKSVATPFGILTVKQGWLNGKLVRATPEFESCRQAAAQSQVPLQQVYQAVNQAISSRFL